MLYVYLIFIMCGLKCVVKPCIGCSLKSTWPNIQPALRMYVGFVHKSKSKKNKIKVQNTVKETGSVFWVLVRANNTTLLGKKNVVGLYKQPLRFSLLGQPKWVLDLWVFVTTEVLVC